MVATSKEDEQDCGTNIVWFLESNEGYEQKMEITTESGMERLVAGMSEFVASMVMEKIAKQLFPTKTGQRLTEREAKTGYPTWEEQKIENIDEKRFETETWTTVRIFEGKK